MGRPRSFDESALLDAAEELFWTRGLDKTSVEDVSSASGVGNGSIYAAYRSKMGLFLTVFERYCDRRAAFVAEVIDAATGSVHAAVSTYFDAVIADCASHPDRRGCLMLNTVAQLGDRVPEVVAISSRSNERMEASIAARIRKASTVLDEDEVRALSAHVVLVSQGLIQLSRQGAPAERILGVARVSCGVLPESLAG